MVRIEWVTLMRCFAAYIESNNPIIVVLSSVAAGSVDILIRRRMSTTVLRWRSSDSYTLPPTGDISYAMVWIYTSTEVQSERWWSLGCGDRWIYRAEMIDSASAISDVEVI